MSHVPAQRPIVDMDIQISIGGSEPVLAETTSQRELWQHRTKIWSSSISQGDLHFLCSILSLVVLLAQLLWNRARHSSPQTKSRPQKGLSTWRYTATQIIFSTAALGLSIPTSLHRKSWKEPVALSYLLALQVFHLVSRASIWKVTGYHHLNVLAFFFTGLETVASLLPLTIVGSLHRPSPIESAKLGCLLAINMVSFMTPRSPGEHEKNKLSSEPAKTVSPEETCSWFSNYVSYEWLTYVIWRGFSKDLSMEDLPPLPAYDAPELLLRRIRKARHDKNRRILPTLCYVFSQDIVSIVSWSFLTGIVEYLGPLSMFHLLRYLDNPDTSTNGSVVHPFLWISLLFVGPMVRSICYQRSIFLSTRLLVRVKGAVIQEIHHKMLSSRIEGSRDGKDIDSPLDSPVSVKTDTLVSYDADAIANLADIFYALTASTVSTAVAMTLLYQILGWPSLVGIAVLISVTPLSALLSGRLSCLQKFVLEATDDRLSKLSEYLYSIKTIKYFGWDAITVDKIDQVRVVEQQRIWTRTIIAIFVSMTGDMLSLMSLLAMFSWLVLFTNKPLLAPAAFTALAITEILRTQYVWLTKVAQWAAQGRESIRRFDDFLTSDIEKQHHPLGPPQLLDATFRVASSSQFRLRKLCILFRESGMNVITGPTGSGKTSLLLSLLGETILESGQVTCPQDVAYVPQTAWLENSTIRQNILFHSPCDDERYNEVLDVCDLVDDIRHMAEGDSTRVGEQGSALSGGQKQRISLARALYSPAPTLLLDDVFSALDSDTTAKVYSRCFRSGLLARRTVVLVTHLAAAMEDADLLVTLNHGAVANIREASIYKASNGKYSVGEHEITRDASSQSSSESISVSSILSTSSTVDGTLDMTKSSSATSTMGEQEKRASGRVPRQMIWKYLLLFGGYPAAMFAILGALSVQIVYFSITFWLSIWTSRSLKLSSSRATSYLLVYAGTVFAFVTLQALNNFNYQRGGWHAAKTMHERLVKAVVYAPMWWFDHTPAGQILNRFGPDIQSMDSLLVDWLRMSLDNGLRFILRLASISSIMPIFVLPAAIICLLGFVTGELYSCAEVSIKRLCATSFSPVFSHFKDIVAGMPVIRGRHGMNDTFQHLLADKVAVHMRACEAQYNCNRWVSIRSDLCAATIAAAAGWIAYCRSDSAGLVGFSLTNAIGLSQTILTLVRNMNELEVELNSFQRISEYAEIEPEEPVTAEAFHRQTEVPAAWPCHGRIELEHVSVRYGTDGPDVLHDINLTIRPAERVAIIGRTGSGKSTLGLSLLRSTQIASGRILVDGVDISTVPLQCLRTSISLIPQETALFSGDVRSNLDPAGSLDHTELNAILTACSETQSSSDGSSFHDPKLKLYAHTPVMSGGSNFSNGQKQIIGLARAICRRPKIIIMDETTASVDHETDRYMQQLIRSEFAGSTIITIAHRLRTIMDYDTVVVMADGRIQEAGSPSTLIQRRGMFWELIKNSSECDQLMSLLPPMSS